MVRMSVAFVSPSPRPLHRRELASKSLLVLSLVRALVWVGPLGLVGVQVATAANGDPPARVGHASFFSGLVQTSVDGENWQPAAVGAPLTTRWALRTLASARVDLRIGSTALRMAPDGQLQFEQLDDRAVVIALQNGRFNLRLQRCCQGGDRLAVLLDGARFDATSAGSYHLEVQGRDLRATARVFAGSGTLTFGDQRVALTAGQQVVIDTQAMRAIKQGAAERRAMDDWADEADQKAQARAVRGTALFAPAEMTGINLLDEHGAWREDPRFGAVWYPRGVASDWAPYRQGHWSWVPPWGWAWIDDAPWGFAPFHYGRWVFLGGRWGWLPGNPQARPVYAAALVGFYGTPPGGWGLASGAVVGWYPLGPGEFYRPPGEASPTYLQAMNAALGEGDSGARAAAGAAASHRYAQTSFAATVVTKVDFESGQPVARLRLEVPPGTLAGAPALGSNAAPPAPVAVNRPLPGREAKTQH